MTNRTLLDQLTIDEEPVKELYPRWEAVSRHSAPGDMDVVLFHEPHINREACWWVTHEGKYLASHTLALQPDDQKKIIDQLMPILLPLLEETLTNKPKAPLPLDHPVFQKLKELPLTPLMEVVGLWCHYVAPGTIMLSSHELLNDNDPKQTEKNTEEYSASPFTAERMRQALSCHYNEAQLPVVISPFSYLPLKPQLIMKYQTGVTCRFFDPIEDVTFYLFWSSSHYHHPVFYYPRGPLIIGDSHEAGLLPTRLMVWFLQHPEHFKIIKDSPSFRLEDYGVGQTSNVWKTFSTSTEDDVGAISPPEHTPIWDP